MFLTKRGMVEVYKSVINYVIEIPVKATRMFIQHSDPSKAPQELAL